MTQVFAMLDEQDMAGVVLWIDQECIELMVGLGDIATSYPSQAIGDPTHMCVDGTDGCPHGEHEDAGCCFDADAVLLGEPRDGVCCGHLLQEIE
jgi:hypothetical protein